MIKTYYFGKAEIIYPRRGLESPTIQVYELNGKKFTLATKSLEGNLERLQDLIELGAKQIL